MTDHSKTPWQLCHHLESAENDAACQCGYRGGIWGDDGELLVCEMRNCDLHEGHEMTPVGSRAVQLANAAFIVKACNAHEAYEELDRATSYYIARLEDVNRGKVVRDLGEAESWYRFALGKLIETAEPAVSVPSADHSAPGETR